MEKSIKMEKSAYLKLINAQFFLLKTYPNRNFSKKRILSMAVSALIEKLNEMYGKTNQEDN